MMWTMIIVNEADILMLTFTLLFQMNFECGESKAYDFNEHFVASSWLL